MSFLINMLSCTGSVKRKNKTSAKQKEIVRKKKSLKTQHFEFQKKNIFCLHGNCWSKEKAVKMLEVHIYLQDFWVPLPPSRLTTSIATPNKYPAMI